MMFDNSYQVTVIVISNFLLSLICYYLNMKTFLIVLAFAPMLCYSQKYIGRSWADCYTSLSDYEIIGKSDTIKGLSRVDQSVIMLLFKNKVCYQEVEYFDYSMLRKKLTDIREKWILKGHVKANALMYQKEAYFLMLEFLDKQFSINIIKP